jgi:hypothetical protein
MAHVLLYFLPYLLERLTKKKLEDSGFDMTGCRVRETIGGMEPIKARLKEKDYPMKTDPTHEITHIFEALHYQMPARILPLLTK